MIRTQISLDEHEYAMAKTEAQSLGLTVRGIEVSGDVTRGLVAEQPEAAPQQQPVNEWDLL